MMYAELAGNCKKQGIKSPCDNTIVIELGTGRRGELSGGAGVVAGMKSRPYLRPAIENHKDEYSTVVRMEMQNG